MIKYSKQLSESQETIGSHSGMGRKWESIQAQDGTTRTSSLPLEKISEGGQFVFLDTIFFWPFWAKKKQFHCRYVIVQKNDPSPLELLEVKLVVVVFIIIFTIR